MKDNVQNEQSTFLQWMEEKRNNELAYSPYLYKLNEKANFSFSGTSIGLSRNNELLVQFVIYINGNSYRQNSYIGFENLIENWHLSMLRMLENTFYKSGYMERLDEEKINMKNNQIEELKQKIIELEKPYVQEDNGA